MKRILEDCEAKLRPPPGRRRGRGKAEWERYADGSEELDARFRKLELPDGSSVEVRLDGAVLGCASVSAGAGRLKLESLKGEEVPKAVPGQVVEVVHDGVALLAGVFKPD